MTTTTRPVFTAWHGRSEKDRWCHARRPASLDLETGSFDADAALEQAKKDADVAVDLGLLGWVTDRSGAKVYEAVEA